MSFQPGKPFNPVPLTPAQAKGRRMRNLAIGLAIGCLVALFYAITVAKLGGNVLRQG